MYSLNSLKNCNLCQDLTKNRTQVVVGDGKLRPQILFIGEAPGAQAVWTQAPKLDWAPVV